LLLLAPNLLLILDLQGYKEIIGAINPIIYYD